MSDKDYSFFLEGTSGKGVILVHGLTGTPSEMKFVGKKLNRLGFTVYAPTLAGHCRDEAALLATRYEDWLQSLHSSLHDFKNKVKEIYIAGICVGGGLGLYLAHLEPELIKKLVIFAPTFEYDGWNQNAFACYGGKFSEILVRIPGMKKVRFKERHPFGIKSDRIRNAIIGNAGGLEGALDYFPAMSLYENYRLSSALKKALPGIKTPTLLIHAREDDVSNPRNAYKLKKLHGGSCEIAILEDSYHMVHIDQERDKVVELTAEFFNKP